MNIFRASIFSMATLRIAEGNRCGITSQRNTVIRKSEKFSPALMQPEAWSKDFEELHLITPGMAWSPDSKRLALAAKSGSEDAIIIIDVKSGEQQKLVFDLEGIFSVHWSPAASPGAAQGGKLAFVGNKNGRSDI